MGFLYAIMYPNMYTRESKYILEYSPLKGIKMKCDKHAFFEWCVGSMFLKVRAKSSLDSLKFQKFINFYFFLKYILKIFI